MMSSGKVERWSLTSLYEIVIDSRSRKGLRGRRGEA
jgi:hypothetical protein